LSDAVGDPAVDRTSFDDGGEETDPWPGIEPEIYCSIFHFFH